MHLSPTSKLGYLSFKWFVMAYLADPALWNSSHVRHWIQWAVKEFSLENVNIDDFKMTGPQLCALRHDEFSKYIPSDKGDIFWTHLELLRKCKFVGTTYFYSTDLNARKVHYSGTSLERQP